MANERELSESRRAQLAELNARVRAHMATLWQMPFAYLGIVALALGTFTERPRLLAAAALFLALTGSFVLWAMVGWLDSVHQAVDAINKVEKALGLDETAKKRPWTHALPHFLIVLLTMTAAIVIALVRLPGA